MRENQVGSLPRTFWLDLGFMMVAFAYLEGRRGLKGSFLNKGVRFLVRIGLNVPVLLPRGLMVAVDTKSRNGRRKDWETGKAQRRG